MAMFSKCPKCGTAIEINKMPEAYGKSSQAGPGERLPNTQVECPVCGNKFLPEGSYLKSA
jgi:endogenous inhibitor of DNA gyrase (YacG/DUF329 family)